VRKVRGETLTVKLSEYFSDRGVKPFLLGGLAVAVIGLSLPPFGGAGFLYKWVRFEFAEDEFRGTPPYRTKWEVRMTPSERKEYDRETGVRTKIAMVDFPDPYSCLEDDIDALTPETLRRMDWEKMSRTAQVNVCTFRLLAASGDISRATEWLEYQGFRVPDRFSSADPFVELDGSLRVYGTWSIRDNGPKFNQSGVLHALFSFTPFDMNINTYWSADGHQLQYVSVGYSYK
jgi:hypothetical protein